MFGHQDDNQTFDEQPTMAADTQHDSVINSSPTNDAAMDEPDDTSVQSVDDDMSMPSSTAPTAVDDNDNDLLQIKQQALSQLSPLVGHLDQDPIEKFHTLMMMIQASDNQSLIKEAYTVAASIPDEKQKAQALLDIVNEINYFTHPHEDN